MLLDFFLKRSEVFLAKITKPLFYKQRVFGDANFTKGWIIVSLIFAFLEYLKNQFI